MKIIIVSDTHGNLKNFKKVVDFANNENIKLIFHCGDIGSPEFLKESLQNFNGKFFGVLGNMDKDYKIELKEYNKIVGVKIEEEIFINSYKLLKGKNIVITHKPDKAKILAESGKYDFVFYGHTHKPWKEKIGDCYLINPGELAGQIFKPCFAVYDNENNFLQLKILENLLK